MARPKGVARDVQTVAVPRELANRLRVIATHRMASIPDTLISLAGKAVDAEYRKVLAELNRKLESQEG